jgi:hypothetical protein
MAGWYDPNARIPGTNMTNQDRVDDLWDEQAEMVSKRGMNPSAVPRTYPLKIPTHSSMTWHAGGGVVQHANKSYKNLGPSGG